MPAYVVLHDSSLDEICRLQPTSIADLLNITGSASGKRIYTGKRFCRRCGGIAKAREPCAAGEEDGSSAGDFATAGRRKSFEDIARIRGRQIATVVNAVAGLVEKGEVEFRPEWIDRNKLAVIEAACANLGLERLERLKTLKDALPPEITYDEIRLVVARLRREASTEEAAIPA